MYNSYPLFFPQLFVTYHSYGQYILYPWGYDKSKDAPNWRKMHAMAEVAGRAMQDNSGHKYTIGSAAKVLYPAAGEWIICLDCCDNSFESNLSPKVVD